jgi:CheY-like chemotaxis protein
MKILVLDDEKALLQSLRGMLTSHGHTVTCSDNAAEAVDMVKHTAFDVVLVDYKMPGNDGIWFMQHADLPRATRVILITAYVNREVINRMFELGAAAYLIKPFSEDELLRHLAFVSGRSAGDPAE